MVDFGKMYFAVKKYFSFQNGWSLSLLLSSGCVQKVRFYYSQKNMLFFFLILDLNSLDFKGKEKTYGIHQSAISKRVSFGGKEHLSPKSGLILLSFVKEQSGFFI